VILSSTNQPYAGSQLVVTCLLVALEECAVFGSQGRCPWQARFRAVVVAMAVGGRVALDFWLWRVGSGGLMSFVAIYHQLSRLPTRRKSDKFLFADDQGNNDDKCIYCHPCLRTKMLSLYAGHSEMNS
jgi:hypothetical protein